MSAATLFGGALALPVRDIGEAVIDNLSESIAPSSNKTYETAWRDWKVFCDIRGELPVIVGGHTTESRADADRLLQFCVFVADTLERAAGTVKN